jgi:hypothetical protein
MESKELRVGNLVYESKLSKILRKKIGVEICEIKSLNIHHLESFPESENFEPIPLTEEWLLKFGYIKGKIYYTEKEHGIISFYFNDSEELKCEVYDWTYDNIKYVHQLQNLYFALTGKELTNIK